MDIIPILALKDNYVWTIVDKDHHTALVVDPGEAAPVISFLKEHKLTLKGILITHHHWDHTAGIAELIQQQNVPVVGLAHTAGITLPVTSDQPFRVPSFSLHFQVIAIPGHTLDHVAYYSPNRLFCGDTLFSAGCGRVFEGTPEQMYMSLQKIAALPDDTQIYCAHEYTLNNLRFAEVVEPNNAHIKTQLAEIREKRKNHLPTLPSLLEEEKRTNPFLRCDSKELIASVEHYSGQKLNSPVEVFTWLRKWKDGFQ